MRAARSGLGGLLVLLSGFVWAQSPSPSTVGLAPELVRVRRTDPLPSAPSLDLVALRGETVAFHACGFAPTTVSVSWPRAVLWDQVDVEVRSPSGWSDPSPPWTSRHGTGWYPDPLRTHVPGAGSRCVLVDLPTGSASPGSTDVRIVINEVPLNVRLTVKNTALPAVPTMQSYFQVYNFWMTVPDNAYPSGSSSGQLAANLKAIMGAHRVTLGDPPWWGSYADEPHHWTDPWSWLAGKPRPRAATIYTNVWRMEHFLSRRGGPWLEVPILYAPGATDDRIRAWKEQFAARQDGERKEVWWYAIGEHPNDTLSWAIDYDLTDYALAPVAAFTRDVKGILLWTVTRWECGDPWVSGCRNGYGLLVYPSRTRDPNALHPSLRLKALRAGMVLHDYLAQVAASDPSFARQQAESLARGFFDVTHNPALFAAVKAALAARLP
ncbi:MAG: hypothetical protein ACREJR_00215 [Candidatus Rokuibacteriota bacterium]